MFNAKDNISEELSMQVDDEAQNYIILSTPTLSSTVLVLSIPNEVIKYAKEDLGLVIKPDQPDHPDEHHEQTHTLFSGKFWKFGKEQQSIEV